MKFSLFKNDKSTFWDEVIGVLSCGNCYHYIKTFVLDYRSQHDGYSRCFDCNSGSNVYSGTDLQIDDKR